MSRMHQLPVTQYSPLGLPVQAQMVRELGAIIRNQIPSGRGSLLDSYGEILLRAWRECTAASLLAVEDLIQVRSSWISPHLLDQRAGDTVVTFDLCAGATGHAHRLALTML